MSRPRWFSGAIVLKLLLEPAMRFLTWFRLRRALCAILLILAIFAVFLGFGAFVSGPAVNWAHRLPSDLPHVQEKLQFLSRPAKAVTDMLHKAETFGQRDQAKSLTLPNIDFASILFRGTQHFASVYSKRSWCCSSCSSREAQSSASWLRLCRALETSVRSSISHSRSKATFPRISLRSP